MFRLLSLIPHLGPLLVMEVQVSSDFSPECCPATELGARTLSTTGLAIFMRCAAIWLGCPGEQSFQKETSFLEVVASVAEVCFRGRGGCNLANRSCRKALDTKSPWLLLHTPTSVHQTVQYTGELSSKEQLQPKNNSLPTKKKVLT